MTLTDAGPLVAVLDRGEANHQRCVLALSSLTLPLVTTWPAFSEAMYLLGRGGWQGQEALWRLVLRGSLELSPVDTSGQERAYELMRQYRDVPMDLADATLLVVAERQGIRRIFTLDSDFGIYRINGRQPLQMVP